MKRPKIHYRAGCSERILNLNFGVSTEKNCSEETCPQETEKCPEDSYRLPAYKSPEDCCSIPQSCQCLPRGCDHQGCPKGKHPVVVREGNSKPGTCCPLINCEPDTSKKKRKHKLFRFSECEKNLISAITIFPVRVAPKSRTLFFPLSPSSSSSSASY